jgi:hypothetical protein
MSQRDEVLRLLVQARDHGVSAHELVYTHGITRGAAVVFDLKQEGYEIETVDEGNTPDGRQKLARYVLRAGPDGAPPAAPPRRLPPPEPEPMVEPVAPERAMDEWRALGERLRAKANPETRAERLRRQLQEGKS